MERFTTSSDHYIKEIKTKLQTYNPEENWNTIFTYVEVPYFLGYAFSYNWSQNIQTLKYRLRRKEWNSTYDNARFDKGIYNLDRLTIKEVAVSVNDETTKYLKLIQWNDIGIIESKGVILDGLICELKIRKHKILIWNIDSQMNKSLKSLIDVIRHWKREMS